MATTKTDLTPSMMECLRELCRKGNKARYMASMRCESYYFLSSTMKRCTPQVEALLKRGLAKIDEKSKDWRGHVVYATPAGRMAAQQQDEGSGR